MLVLALCAAALFLRAFFTHDQVLGEGYVRLRGTDAWYHLRLAESRSAHFPRGISYDPYLRHPGGAPVEEAPLSDAVLAAAAWAAAGGRPSTELLELLAAWLPAVLGALVTIPVYAAAHLLWGRPAGLIAGALAAVLPGRFLERSLLGAADHHVAEILCSSCCLTGLLLAFRAAGESSSPRARRRALGWAAAAGLALAAYLLSWRSGTALPCLLGAWLVVQHVADALRGRFRNTLRWIAPTTLGSALLAVLPASDGQRVPHRHALALLAALAAALALAGLAAWQERRGASRRRCLLELAALGAAGLLAAGLALPGLAAELSGLLGRLRPTSWGMTVAEMRPPGADDSVAAALWRELGGALIAAGAGLALLLGRSLRHARPADLLLLTWSLAMLAASLAQRRFTAYLDIVAALLSAAAVAWLLGLVRSAPRRTAALAVLAGLLMVPGLAGAVARAQRPSGPDATWHRALTWLRESTPEPFADPDVYHAAYPAAAASPTARYGVLSWWDRGFWLVRIARRVPIANPKGHGIATAAAFYLARDEASACRLLEEAGGRYVVTDAEMPIRQVGGSEIGVGTLHSMAVWAGQPPERFVERYEMRAADGSWRPRYLYAPAYFRTMAIRLQTFAGRAASPKSSIWVVTARPHRRADGAVVQRVTRLRTFRTHARAAAFLARQGTPRDRLVSPDPAASCVPLAALERLRRVYPAAPGPAAVQIFELREPP